MIPLRGMAHISSQEIEDVPMLHRAVFEAVVVAQPDDRHTTPELLHVADELPRTASGKLQKFPLRVQVRDGSVAGWETPA